MVNKKKVGCGVARIDPSLQGEIEELLNKNDNKIYCVSVSNFIKIAVRELLDRIKENENKMRLASK
jgi:Arc/MetJ-type ribon-helix-helix transcriptional regulator